MSFVVDQVQQIDAQLDRIRLPNITLNDALSPESQDTEEWQTSEVAPDHNSANLTQIQELQILIRALSTASTSRPLVPAWRLTEQLKDAQRYLDSKSVGTRGTDGEGSSSKSEYQRELEWLLVSKATTQTYGLILNALLEQIIPLSNDIWYWDEVLSSYTYTGVYTIQTSPARIYAWSKEIYQDARGKLESIRSSAVEEPKARQPQSLSDRWKQFYGLVKDSVRERSVSDVQSKVMSRLTICRVEARKKQLQLKKLREMSASGLGVLMDEGLTFDIDEDGSSQPVKGQSAESSKDEWKSIVAKSVALMETVLQNITNLETGVSDFEDTVFMNVEEDPDLVLRSSEEDMLSRPGVLISRLQQILQVHMPAQSQKSKQLAQAYGRPSRVTRYWLPITVALLSSTTLLRIFFNRRTQIIAFIADIGTTVQDFWFNWVVTPVKKIIGTIKHDKDSEVAIMSKSSLEGDRASLERMVVDFAVDNSTGANGGALSESDIADVRSKVKEGDLTPVLKAYEKDLRKPFMGTVRGDLIRALLIQIQKTKVDVEVAMKGIDSLLKSQELVFGFVGLTPGVLVCLGVGSWLSNAFGGRNSRAADKKQGRMVRVLRNIDRILTASTPSTNGMLSYKEHGLLLCEVHILRSRAEKVIPSEIHREFLEEINDLVDIRTGVQRQLKVVERIRWAYRRWIQ
ncbi:Nuclear control of ATPase protein 2 [Agyrium rufum]|nr:Nuclear control of ATPase protein 2 [Agyrium rufum]